MMIVLDTNVLSEVMKPRPAAEVAGWMLRERGDRLYTTAVCEAEIHLGIALLPDGRRKQELETAALRVLALLSGRILVFDSSAATQFARIVADRRRVGRPIEDFDAQIAAITLSRGMMLATRNGPDFVGTGLALVDPWTS
jgi:toxin FitB